MNWLERKILGFFVKTKGVFSAPFFAGKGVVFMLHRVLPEIERNTHSLNKDLAITPEKFEEFILFFKQKGYVFISLDELQDWLERKKVMRQKFICITFDDGYRDNLIYALPILKKHNVPATIYITNCLPNGTGILWWYLFEEYVKKANNFILNSSIGRIEYNWESIEHAHNQFGSVSESIKSIPADELKSVLSIAFKKTTSDFEQLCQSVSLSWKDIITLSKEPLISIGAHTMNHISVKQQRTNLVEFEMRVSKKEIEQYIGQEVKHFAYPFGGKYDVCSRDIEIAHLVGFKTSTLNQPGNIFRSNNKSMQAIARMPLGNSSDEQRMKYYLNGIYHFSNNQFNQTINILK